MELSSPNINIFLEMYLCRSLPNFFSYILGGTSKSQKTKFSCTYKQIFIKTLEDNSCHVLYKLNQSTLLLYKKITFLC